MSKRLTSSMEQISLNYATEYLGGWIFLFSIAPLFCPIPPLLPWSLYSQGIGGVIAPDSGEQGTLETRWHQLPKKIICSEALLSKRCVLLIRDLEAPSISITTRVAE